MRPSIFLRIDKYGNASDIENNKYNIYFDEVPIVKEYECVWSMKRDSWKAYSPRNINIIGYNMPYSKQKIKFVQDLPKYPVLLQNSNQQVALKTLKVISESYNAPS